MEIYVPLYIAYMRAGKSRDAQALVDEVNRAQYPGSGLRSNTARPWQRAEKNKKNND